ncbi:MAG: polysaccharide deacetylase family protein [Desulfobacteraceae bacterium]|jgi:peptidoglycan/xylan/chitin deacetylase (PgdA/CDA1 family)
MIRTDQFVIVTVKKGETLQSMARDHLNDGSKWPIIAAYNRIDAVAAGQRLVVPLQPTQYGGLSTRGYQTIPILLYTQIKQTPKTAHSVSPKTFERQMNYLTAAKFKTITLDQFFGFVQLADQPPSSAVMICFDGADRWIYDVGFPVLRREGLSAALFIPVDQIDQPGKLTWIELSEMAANGMDIGVLGKEIIFTPGKDPDKHLSDLEREIVAAKKAIEHHLNPAGHYFAYPKGKRDDLTIALLKKHGYRLGFTRKSGSNPFFVHNFNIRRTIIKDQSSMQQFQKNLVIFQKAQLK